MLRCNTLLAAAKPRQQAIGHVIGMAHAPDDINSVMGPGAICIRITELPRSDVENVRKLYG